MKYMGSKNRHAKELLPIILKNRQSWQFYVEPFAGGFNMIDKVDGNRIAADTNFYLIALFRAIQDGWIPPVTVTETEYTAIRKDKDAYPPHLVGFVGFGCSYSGKWFGGYARGNANNGQPRNYCEESRKNIMKQAESLKGVTILQKDYLELDIPAKSVIYCDPPYAGTTKYASGFNHTVFWGWVRAKVSDGHTVFVSEYTAPADFTCIWSKTVNNSLEKDTGSKQGTECLFTLNERATA